MTDGAFPRRLDAVPEAVVAAADEHRNTHAPHVQSLLAVHRGSLVWERYYGGEEQDIVWPRAGAGGSVEISDPYPASHSATELHNLKSCTKSVMATLIGIAVDRGDLPDADASVASLLPGYFAGVDPAKREISIRHLLTMRSGLGWEENGPPTLDWMNADDLVAFTVRELPLVADPGSRWCYSTADSHLLSAVLSAAVGRSTLEYAREHLFNPLGFGEHRWSTDPQGLHIGGSELFLTGPDMLRFGRLALQRGRWNGVQLVSGQWMEMCVAAQPDVTADTILAAATPPGMTWPVGVRTFQEGYGHQWWRSTIAGHPSFLAEGLGGQVILVVDGLELVVTMTASTELGPPEDFPAAMAAQFGLVEDFVVPHLA